MIAEHSATLVALSYQAVQGIELVVHLTLLVVGLALVTTGLEQRRADGPGDGVGRIVAGVALLALLVAVLVLSLR